MQIIPKKRAARACVSLAVAAGLFVAASTPASAVDPPPDPTVPVPIVLAGADATTALLDYIFQGTPNVYNLPATPGASGYLVPAKGSHAPETKWIFGTTANSGLWDKTVTPFTRVAPNGAGAGLNLLKAQETALSAENNGIDIVRSSNAPRGLATDPAGFEYYAFALDSVGWASTSLSAPASITKQQLKDIYNCVITDWSQLPGGGSGPIKRYMAQNTTWTDTSSGTWSFFRSDMLDGITPPNGVAGTSCPPPGNTQQSTATFVPNPSADSGPANLGLEAEDYQSAIFLYGSGVWSYQANNSANPTIDKRNGARLGAITHNITPLDPTPTLKPLSPIAWDSESKIWTLNTAGPVSESNVKVNSATPATVYPGIRYQYLTLDNHASSVNYDLARSLVGFDNVFHADPGSGAVDVPTSDISSLCNGGKVSAILSAGFGPLDRSDPTIGVHAGGNLAHATCRLFINH